MRALQTNDIFRAARMISGIGIKDDIKKILMEANSVKDIVKEESAFEFMCGLLEKVTGTKGEQEIYKFLAPLMECEPKEIATMDPVDCMEAVMEIADVEKWKDFFMRLLRLMKLN